MTSHSGSLYRYAAAAVVVSVLLATPNEASAFSYEEHCRISNRALILAVQVVKGRERATPLSSAQLAVLDSLARHAGSSVCSKGSGASVAYGDLVSRVDWALTPADFYLTMLPGNGARSTDVMPADLIAALMTRLQSLRLLHENSEHFGARGLFSFRQFHRLAIDVATTPYAPDEARLNTAAVALMYNAFADHYLEDLFAPGHVFSPRTLLNDAQAGGTHNWYNKRGAYFQPRHSERLAVYAHYLADTSQLARQLRARSCVQISLTDCARSLNDSLLLMFGDERLEDAPRQELLVSLVIARSVDDVLEAWTAAGTGRGEDSFGTLRWCGYERVSQRRGSIEWISPNVILPFGEYRVEEHAGLPHTEYWPTWRAGTEYAFDGTGYASLAGELMWLSYPGDWLGAQPSAIPSDRFTTLGLDVRLPMRGVVSDELTGGAYVRGIWAFNRINSRFSAVVGARGGGSFGELHVDPAIEMGFGLLHLAIGPSVMWKPYVAENYEGRRWTVSLGTTLSATAPHRHWRSVPRMDRPLPQIRSLGNCGTGPSLEIR